MIIYLQSMFLISIFITFNKLSINLFIFNKIDIFHWIKKIFLILCKIHVEYDFCNILYFHLGSRSS